MNEPFKATARESIHDDRTVIHDLASPIIYTKGGNTYTDHENQHKEGICTAISLVQNAEVATRKKYSPDFMYLLGKKFIDGDFQEGSSIFSMLKAGNKYGFLPIELFTYITEQDRLLSYEEYTAKLQAISDTEITRLLSLCEHPLTGYAQVDASSKENIAHAVDQSKSGVLCRYSVGSEWWTPSWLPSDIDPLRSPQNAVGGHAINLTAYDYTNGNIQLLSNTWGNEWCVQGNAHINYDNYKPTEVWIPYYDVTPKPVQFTSQLQIGSTGNEVKMLQETLKKLGFFPATQVTTSYFGQITKTAVMAFQKVNSIQQLGIVGPITRLALNNALQVPKTAQGEALSTNSILMSDSIKQELYSLVHTLIAVGLTSFFIVLGTNGTPIDKASLILFGSTFLRVMIKATSEKYLQNGKTTVSTNL